MMRKLFSVFIKLFHICNIVANEKNENEMNKCERKRNEIIYAENYYL